MELLCFKKLSLVLLAVCCYISRLHADLKDQNPITHDKCVKPNGNCEPNGTRSASHCWKIVYTYKKVKESGSWWRKPKYKTESIGTNTTICCDGHYEPGCFPKCDGSNDLYACNRLQTHVVRHKDNKWTECSGGACIGTDKCINCNLGYYASDKGYCTACTSIENCDIPTCTKKDSSTCLKCSGEVICDTPGWYVYTKAPNRSQCQRACSWRPGARCYPGTCGGDMVLSKDCTCAEGFTNHGDCDTFKRDAHEMLKPKVLGFEAFLNKTNHPGFIIPDPEHRDRKMWTNVRDWMDVSIGMTSQYIANQTSDPPPYIVKKKTKIGIKSVRIEAALRRGTIDSTSAVFNNSCNFETNCDLTTGLPIPFQRMPWNAVLGPGSPIFNHLDSIDFTAFVVNGGNITYNDWDSKDESYNHKKVEKYYLIKGIEVSQTITVGFDFYTPTHCAEQSTPCSIQPLVLEDFFETPSIDVTWDGWADDDSGLKEYRIDLYALKVNSDPVAEGLLEHEHSIVFETVVNAGHQNSATVNFTHAGPYFVEMSVYDWAGNHKTTRRICLFDNNSTVSLIGDNPNVTLATTETEKQWIKKEFSHLTLVWPNRFRNTKHHVNGWLNPVKELTTIARELDDTINKSLRTTEQFHNIKGVVRVDVRYQIATGFGNPPKTNDFITVSRTAFDAQQFEVQEDSNDGDKYTFLIRGYDAIGKYAEDTYSVKVDTTPPVITYLWLTKGDFVNVSVHDVTEFKELTIEWEVYDSHSGIYEISWRLFDNYTDDVIVHGKADERSQGEASTLEECETKYGSYARGPQCYCTPFDGCHHRHYQIKPPITNTGSDGLHEGKHFGIHEGDYFIEVVVTNKARLETKRDFKITIDTSPPHEGSVHDGLKGQNEIDFQQSLSLRSNWNGFFDKESGVWFYMYKYGTACIQNEEFDLTWTEDHAFTKTYNTEGHFEATEPGTYYVTVAAYNHALDHSLPVCSDGVTIDSNPAQTSEVVVRGAVTKPGLIKTIDDAVVYLHKDRTLQTIENPSHICINSAMFLTKDEISMIPERRDAKGSKNTYHQTTFLCETGHATEDHILSFVTSDSHLDISWNVSSTPSGIHDFEVGLSSHFGTNPDRSNFVSSKQHQRIRLMHPNVWNEEEFYVILKTITKSNIENIQSVGPFIVCKSTPTFTGTISVEFEAGSDYLIARWDSGSFECDCDPYQLLLEVAVGSERSHDDVMPFKALTTGGACADVSTCTAIDIRTLPWNIHGYKKYYVIIKATNVVGSSTLEYSDAYIHAVDLASEGVVFDVDKNSGFVFDDTVDIDFQLKSTELTATWTGFEHPYLDSHLIVCVKEKQAQMYLRCEDPGTDEKYTFTGLTLETSQTYIQVVIAETNYGNVSASSDGVTVFDDGGFLNNVTIQDGPSLHLGIRKADSHDSHHDADRIMPFVDDIEYQRSTNELQAHWIIPADVKQFTSDIYWSVEERAGVAEHWETILDYEHHRFTTNISVHDLFLQAGRKYRFSIKFCAELYCFQQLRSNGVMVISNPPETGAIGVVYNNMTKMINVEMDRFFDPDIPNFEEAVEIMDHYEWTLTDNSHHGNILFKWSHITMDKNDSNTIWFAVPLEKQILFTKCWRMSVRGYTKAGLFSTVSNDIRNCTDIHQVRPSVVIDATGIPVFSGDAAETIHEGQTITLAQNAYWLEEDKDYTTYNNIISAVWPTLRYGRYQWAVLEVQPTDPVLYYNTIDLELPDPCSHPDTFACGETGNEYMNAMFDENIIQHGHRYVVCIHANATVNVFEKSTQELPEISVCSNGITVDITPPTPNDVWIGNQYGQKYQTTANDIAVNWKAFTDVEEEGNGVHQSGIMKYEVAIGSSYNGVDVVDFTNVGVTNYVTFHGLRLQNGHSYFASVKATDFTNQTSRRTATSIKIDTTAPDVTGKSITLNNRRITSKSAVYTCWTGVFVDDQSGISHYEWGIGSHPGYDDIYTFTMTDQECGDNSVDEPLTLIEGHSYIISVKAHNNAGLIRIASSWAFTVDASPPGEGHVYDGPKVADVNFNDIDYVTNTSVVEAHWTEFYDHHSPVIEYYMSAGTCKECDNVLQRQAIGIIHELRLDLLHLVEGMRYFVSITACNAANLCSTSSSDGVIVDTSPPVAGRVLDGIEGRDVQYQTSRLHIGAEWYGFVDPQSGISHYVWRIGTQMYGDDIYTASNVHNQQQALIIDYQLIDGKKLPVGVRIYSTIRAYNKAGMYTESCSNGFIIDDTAPVIKQPLIQSSIGTTVKGTSVLRSILKVHWGVKDDESFIDEQYLSLSSHAGGEFNLSSTKVEGIVRDYTFTGLQLHDGSYYDIHLTACNGAKHCVDSSVTNILVDSSPPTPGMFAIDTDHAANLLRQPDSWMTWSVVGLRLAWIGFEDIHSGIDRYMINIGSSFFNDDLNQVPGEPISILHNDNGEVFDEGTVQVIDVRTAKFTINMRIFVSMWAINKAGLSSPVLHGEFELVFGGIMSLVRRCNAHTCYGHCVCAPHGKTCKSDTLCNDVTKDNSNSLFDVELFHDMQLPTSIPSLTYSPINSMMRAKWKISQEQGKLPQWYEWSIGESQYDVPQGVYNEVVERVWHDAGRNTSWIVTLTEDHLLTEYMEYCFFIRVWYDINTFAIFKSNSVMIYKRPPIPVTIQGSSVKEIMHGKTLDMDYVDRNMHMFINWDGKFNNNKGSLDKYHVYISSSPGGHDVHVLGIDLPTSTVEVNITGLQFENNTRYYSVVQAYNKAGLHTTESSDGFTIDSLPPNQGVVHDGDGLYDVHAINSSDRLSAFWFGFTDTESGIKNYETCISTRLNSRCDIKAWSSVGIATKSAYKNSEYLKDGTIVYQNIRATDTTGHKSPAVRSSGVVIDRTPPVRSYTLRYHNSTIHNPSFEIYKTSTTLENFKDTTACDDVLPESWTISKDSCLVHVQDSAAILPEGLNFVILSGSLSQEVKQLYPGKYRLTFYTSHVLNSQQSELSSLEGYVDFLGQRHVFLIHNKPSLLKEVTGNNHLLSWQEHRFYFHLTAVENVTITIGTAVKSTHLAIDYVQLEVRLVNGQPDMTMIEGHVDAKPVFTNDWSSIHAEWNFIDEESSVVEYIWAIGTVQGGTQLQDFKTVGRQTFAYAYDLHLIHNSVVYVTVVAINRAGLRTVSYSDQIIIDKTPPVFSGIFDGATLGKDIDVQKGNQIMVTWLAEDPESDIKQCLWAIGNVVGDTSIQNFTEVPEGKGYAAVLLNEVPITPIYVTVKCTNYADLSTTMGTDGVLVMSTAPSIDSVFIDVLGVSQTQYTVRDGYHADSKYIKFRWAGFYEDDRIDSFLVGIEGPYISKEELVQSSTSSFSYASFSNLTLEDGTYTVYVTAINQVQMYSQRVTKELILLTQPPELTGTIIQTSWDLSTKAVGMTWTGVFTSPYPMYYEVTAKLAGAEGDLIQWQETTNTELYISLDTSKVLENTGVVQVTVRAISYCGLYTDAKTELSIYFA